MIETYYIYIYIWLLKNKKLIKLLWTLTWGAYGSEVNFLEQLSLPTFTRSPGTELRSPPSNGKLFPLLSYLASLASWFLSDRCYCIETWLMMFLAVFVSRQLALILVTFLKYDLRFHMGRLVALVLSPWTVVWKYKQNKPSPLQGALGHDVLSQQEWPELGSSFPIPSFLPITCPVSVSGLWLTSDHHLQAINDVGDSWGHIIEECFSDFTIWTWICINGRLRISASEVKLKPCILNKFPGRIGTAGLDPHIRILRI